MTACGHTLVGGRRMCEGSATSPALRGECADRQASSSQVNRAMGAVGRRPKSTRLMGDMIISLTIDRQRSVHIQRRSEEE
jgi:hypothetical protein